MPIKKSSIGVGIGLVGLVALGAATMASGLKRAGGDLGETAAMLPKALRAAQEAGVPITTEGLDGPPVPFEQNAAFPIMEAYRLSTHVDLDLLTKKVPDVESTYQHTNVATLANGKRTALSGQKRIRNPEAIRAIKTHNRNLALLEAEPALKIVRIAVTKPLCNFHHNWQAGLNVPVEEDAALLGVTRLLTRIAGQDVAEGKTDEALTNLRNALTIIHDFDSDPLFVVKMGQAFAYGSVAHALQKIVASPAVDERDLVRVDHLLSSFLVPNLREGLQAEAPIELGWMDNPASVLAFLTSNQNSNTDQHVQAPNVSPTALAAYKVRTLEYWTDVFRNWPKGSPTSFALCQRLEAVMREHSGFKGNSYTVNISALNDFGEPPSQIMSVEAERSMTKTMIELVRYRASHGAYPRSLAEAKMSGRDPVSPELPLIYHRVKTGFMLSSPSVPVHISIPIDAPNKG